ncbi:hypothetical protein [Pontibacter sp. G13]|nr:hypothetical protein [Pontibacter sp. G13]WNJ21165.1 hypothetical protein RJD25_11915 [Pontibacter sp. G13]
MSLSHILAGFGAIFRSFAVSDLMIGIDYHVDRDRAMSPSFQI